MEGQEVNEWETRVWGLFASDEEVAKASDALLLWKGILNFPVEKIETEVKKSLKIIYTEIRTFS